MGRVMRLAVMAALIYTTLRWKSLPIGTKTKVSTKKSKASSVHPRKQAITAFRWLARSAASSVVGIAAREC